MKITKGHLRGKKIWILDLGVRDGHRRRQYFHDEESARSALKAAQRDLADVGRRWASIPARDRTELVETASQIKKAGATLAEVWRFYRESSRPAQSVSLDQAIAELAAAKLTAGRRESYITNLMIYLSSFARDRGRLGIATFGVKDVEEWLDRFSSKGSRATALGRLGTLFSFAKQREYVRENPCERIERITQDQGIPSILTLDQVRQSLAFVQKEIPAFLGWLVLGLFAGVRPEEADKIDWGKVDLAAGTVRVDSAKTKVRMRRIIHLMPAAVCWLTRAKQVNAPLPISKAARVPLQRELRDHLGLPAWPKDILRHTAASMLLAHHQDAAKVALELGNSPAVLMRHYRELVMKDDSEKFWAIRPDDKG